MTVVGLPYPAINRWAIIMRSLQQLSTSLLLLRHELLLGAVAPHGCGPAALRVMSIEFARAIMRSPTEANIRSLWDIEDAVSCISWRQ